MEYKYHVLKCAWPGVEDLLLYANCGIRDLAAYILKKHSQLDILAFYEKHLKEPVPVPAILGIGEQGRALDDKMCIRDRVFLMGIYRVQMASVRSSFFSLASASTSLAWDSLTVKDFSHSTCFPWFRHSLMCS